MRLEPFRFSVETVPLGKLVLFSGTFYLWDTVPVAGLVSEKLLSRFQARLRLLEKLSGRQTVFLVNHFLSPANKGAL